MPNQLKRSLSLPLITFYGLGTILGAGLLSSAGVFLFECTRLLRPGS